MPALLANMNSEPVTLEVNGDSPYNPPQQRDDADADREHEGIQQISDKVMAKVKLKEVSKDKDISRNEPSQQALPDMADSRSTNSVVNGIAYNSIESRGARSELDGEDTRHVDSGVPLGNNHDGNGIANVKREITIDQVDSTKSVPAVENSTNPKHARGHSLSEPQRGQFGDLVLDGKPNFRAGEQLEFRPDPETMSKRMSSSLPAPASPLEQAKGASTSSLHLGVPRTNPRQTLEVPRTSTSRPSRDWQSIHGGSGVRELGGDSRPQRPSNTLGRIHTRSIYSDVNTEDAAADEDVSKWTEAIRHRRASRRRRKEEEEDDRVVVGTKVDVHHVNWVTAYNMLTGIRFTVSRINAKIDRPLTDSDFDAKHKFSFDITGNELTPSAKYDFKFKDYAPWVFRHLRSQFSIDPADYLMSLTSKYILSELGSPGKSGSFFYFSRDYKYIIKTIHHAEHKLLRKILRQYFAHTERYPNTLISQFYGLHRVKIPYGRKIHFVVMNNLFPPHRDIHEMFDLKGSTIGRELKEDDLSRNPRATLKDLNWLRRQYHFELGPNKKALFIEQMERDVALLQRLKIMDYSMLVGIHDLSRGNDENLRDKTLRVFQPGAEEDVESQVKMLMRTPSKMENARQAKHLREIIKKERPIPMERTTDKMPDEMLEERSNLVFYADDGGFRATHEDGSPGEEIYYLGIIDCLTHYGFVKRVENFIKGMSANQAQISPIPPQSYGNRFVRFIGGLTMTKEEAVRQGRSHSQSQSRPQARAHSQARPRPQSRSSHQSQSQSHVQSSTQHSCPTQTQAPPSKSKFPITNPAQNAPSITYDPKIAPAPLDTHAQEPTISTSSGKKHSSARDDRNTAMSTVSTTIQKNEGEIGDDRASATLPVVVEGREGLSREREGPKDSVDEANRS